MEYKDYLTGNLEEFGKSIKNSFNVSLDQIPIEIICQGKSAIIHYLSAFFPSFQQEMKKAAKEYWEENNIQVIK